jgi:hypothetical protein
MSVDVHAPRQFNGSKFEKNGSVVSRVNSLRHK